MDINLKTKEIIRWEFNFFLEFQNKKYQVWKYLLVVNVTTQYISL